MAKHVQRFRLNGQQSAQYLGLEGECIVDLSGPTIRVHNGVTPGGYKLLVGAGNLSELTNLALSRTNLGLGSAALNSSSDFDVAGAAAAVQATSLQKSSNLSDVSSASTSRTNLGLGTAAVQNVGYFAQVANNLSDLSNATTARTNLGLGNAATATLTAAGLVTTSHAFTGNAIPVFSVDGSIGNAGFDYTDVLIKANNLAGLASAATARTNLGLGNAAVATLTRTGYAVAVSVSYVVDHLAAFNGDGSISDSALVSTDVLLKSTNLAGLASAATSRTNLGLGTAATQNTGAFDASGAAATAQSNAIAASCQRASNLSDVASPSIALGNLGYLRVNATFTGLTAGSTSNVAHGLGSTPLGLDPILICISTDAGYAVNDTVKLPINNDGSASKGATIWANATNVGMAISSTGISVMAKGGVVITDLTLSKWNLVVRMHS